MIVSSQLTAELRKLVLRLEDDLRERLAQDDENLSRWKVEHQGALDAQRTSSAWQAWRDDKITQAAVAWILTTVFVRFAEDNALVRPVWISGPGTRRQEALDAQIVFFRAHPELTDREWLLEPVEYLKKLAATADLVGEHSALWQVQPSGRMATEILEFWRQTDAAGRPTFDLADTELSTRFLGDLYQDLSDYAKKTFALLQTPEFVEEFILDQTLTPALAERPLDGFKLIDPTCGSGHFLLGAFERFAAAWATQAPGMDVRARVQKALDAVHGVDLNPFAVAIARFRLTIAALKGCGETSLELAPAFDFHLAAGDSLLHGQVQREFQFEGFDADAELSGFAYATEDLEQLRRILKPGQYDVVVGNPPYITVKDKTLNEAYRKRYTTCKGTYALTVPFMERFFGLAKQGTGFQPAGWTGQITSNSFMKREFGSKLIEEFLSRQDVRLVVDTSGAYIPGHGTPTVIIAGRRQRPTVAMVRAALGVRGEPVRPSDPARGLVWRALAENIDNPGHDSEWISIVDLARESLARHPWSLSGGGANAVLTQIEANARGTLKDKTLRIGFYGDSHADEIFFLPRHFASRIGLSLEYAPDATRGDGVRDWAANFSERAFRPYDKDGKLRVDAAVGSTLKHFWPFRSVLWGRNVFGGLTYKEAKRSWLEWHQLPRDEFASALTIGFAEVATHNHFVLETEAKVFNRTAPVIKLPQNATEDDHLSLLGVLNSSVACFWLKQKCHNKGSTVDTQGARQTQSPWEDFYQLNATNIKDLPLPASLPIGYARAIDALVRSRSLLVAEAQASGRVPTAEKLAETRSRCESLLQRSIAQQEDLDWAVYRAFGLIEEDLAYAGGDDVEVALGERAFEIALARRAVAGQADIGWFDRHHSMQTTEIPSRWPASYQDLVQRRLDLIESNQTIRLLERPEYKRRWALESWEKQQERALRGWLLDRLEDRSLWFDRQGRPAARSIGQVADIVSRDEDFLSVLSLWDGTRDVDVVQTLTALLVNETVPYLAAQRLKDSGLRKFEAWEETWDLQRREDVGEDVGSIPVPPKYTSADFRKASWWQARGKLDVPKERFILYPDAGRSTDQTLLLGWAGWNHVEQFLALAAVMDQLVADGAPDEQLIPLVAGMGEILPWVKQWHADTDPAYGVSMADFCIQQLEDRAAQIDRSQEQLKAWRPTMTGRRRRSNAKVRN
ncbi:BREX-2 system adenine-specific DNA-methyltransferase PglX [Pseudarthrobacter sp. SL88]|uniref:BREX-2 system adenine-specific DNA-methyltransferase PglX n=1 Tax=Pseudarthrobacter sp. SL88 TaxID=2994666 RepID=UPI0022743DBD|nr:BREX-2 system adenine-specific DNA-methyltransferase PglX [Pseudarthrobacter sp. SL88]MCY1675612.1 BREX-2 system adenine-specific DNA-methyltransferase PglX [Pseudarthrobacter sp. SL88]